MQLSNILFIAAQLSAVFAAGGPFNRQLLTPEQCKAILDQNPPDSDEQASAFLEDCQNIAKRGRSPTDLPGHEPRVVPASDFEPKCPNELKSSYGCSEKDGEKKCWMADSAGDQYCFTDGECESDDDCATNGSSPCNESYHC